MTTSGISLGNANNQTTNAATQQLTGNFDTFLQLLTTQLQNQDPMNPMDSNQFTQQLVEYSQVEQQINTNSNLQNLIGLTEGNAGSAAVGYLGKNVTASTNGQGALVNSTADWTYNLPSTPASATLTVTNSAGQVVYTQDVSSSATSGANTFSWDGTQNAGNNSGTAPDGTYTLSVTATDSTGAAITPTISFTGAVNEISFQNGAPVMMVGTLAIPLSEVSSIAGS